MGVVSWIKDKYYNNRFEKANRLLSGGDVDGAIEILNEILDKHPDAPSVLLSIRHKEIEEGKIARVSDATSLYEHYTYLKADCIKFANSISHKQAPVIAIDYIQSMYCVGISEIKNLFVNIARQYVLSSQSVANLSSLSDNSTLISALSDSLFSVAKQLYKDVNLRECKRVCELLLPVLSSNEFYKLYSDVRFDVLVLNSINAESIIELDKLFNDVKTRYNLSSDDIKHLTDKGLKVAENSFNDNNYVACLLVSQRLMDKYVEARKLYADSALKLYQGNTSDKKLIEAIYLYKALGTQPADFITRLELFIPYKDQYKEKYLDSVEGELKRLMVINRVQAERQFFHSWNITPHKRLLECVLSNGREYDKIFVASRIMEKDSVILSNVDYLTIFVTRLKMFTNLEYVTEAFEILLSKGKKIESAYEWVILKLAKAAPLNSRKRVEIVTRGLQHIQLQSLFTQKAEYLKDYIKDGRYDKTFVITEVTTLKGKNGLADVLVALVLLDEAKKSQDYVVKEQKLLGALSIRTTHEQLFDKSSYEAIVPEIALEITKVAESIYYQNKDKANSLLFLLRDNGQTWYSTYASLFLNSIEHSKPSSELASSILKIIKEGDDLAITSSLWEKYLSTQLSMANNLELNEAIDYLKSVCNDINTTCNTADKEQLFTSTNKALCKLLISRGKEEEKKKNFKKAINDYENIISLLGYYSDVKARIFICKLKCGSRLLNKDKEEIRQILKSKKDRQYQKDLGFRWCIYLILQNNLSEAEEINNQILGGDSELIQICQEERIKAQQLILDKLNEQISRLNNSDLTAQESIAFGQSLTQMLNDVSLIAPVSSQKAAILKDAIRISAIKKFYEDGDFLDSLNGLKVQDSAYLSDPVALRNIAIMALLAAETGLLSRTNYKELLSIWVTAIYQQKLFVDSLDYTTWDDPYTFSLKDALGHLDNQDDDLPENVNYADPNDANVVSILEVQKNLLLRMEAAIQDNVEYQTFLNVQLEAMDKLASHDLDKSCVIVAPYLLTLSKSYRSNISHALTVEASQHYGNWEEILEVGSMYGLTTGDFGRYSVASSNLEEVIKIVGHKSQVSSTVISTKISTIREFSGLTSQLISSITTVLNNDIAQETDYMIIYKSYGDIIKNVGDDTATFAFSNYINQQVVKRLNDKSITLAVGVPVLFEIYTYCKCNPHLKRNLNNIIEALIHNYITDGDSGNLTVLDNVLSSTREFDQSVVKALKGGEDVPEEMMAILFSSNENRFNSLKTRISSKSRLIQNQFIATSNKLAEIKVQLELSQIVDKVTGGTMSKCDALQKIYAIYQNNKTNSRVCENLAALIPMCIMEYVLPGKIEQHKVESVLNSLKSNMSSTYKSHASAVEEAYDLIWSQLTPDNRLALSGASIYDLTEDGKRLKKALDYMRILR